MYLILYKKIWNTTYITTKNSITIRKPHTEKGIYPCFASVKYFHKANAQAAIFS